MQDPLYIEQAFQEVFALLDRPGYIGCIAPAVHRLLRLLEDDFPRYESYLLEVGERLMPLPDVADTFGVKPEVLEDVLRLLTRARDMVPALDTIESMPRALEALKARAALARVYCGELENACRVLAGDSSLSLSTTSSSDGLFTARSLLSREMASQTGTNMEAAHLLEELMVRFPPPASWKQVYVPVIDSREEGRPCGALRLLTLDEFGTARGESDRVTINVPVTGAGGAELPAIPLAAAKTVVGEIEPEAARRKVSGRLVFTWTMALHEGSSAHLAAAGLFACAMLRDSDSRIQFSLAPDTAMTGNLTSTGAVLPVDPETLAIKVEAAFFSPAATLVVPRAQLAEADRAYESLRERFPNRAMHLVGASHLRELFYDRRVTDLVRMGAAVRLARLAWRKRRSLGALVGLFIATLLLGPVLFRIWYGPFDRNGVGYEIHGESLSITNRYGEEVASVKMDRPTTDLYRAFREQSDMNSPAVLADVTGDGIKDLLWTRTTGDGEMPRWVLLCRDLHLEKDVWSLPLHLSILFPGHEEVADGEFRLRGIRVEDIDGDEIPDVFVTAVHTFFPSFLLRLDARTGNVTARYLHVGHLTHVTSQDVDGRGRRMLFATGVNSAFGQPVLIVLDPDRLDGHSPTLPEYTPLGVLPATERYYLRLPMSTAARAYELENLGGAGTKVICDGERTMIRVDVQDFMFSSSRTGETVSGHLFFHFGFDLALKNVGSGSDFDRVYERLVKRGVIPAVGRTQHLSELKKEILYWDGSSWGTGAIQNRNYSSVPAFNH